MIDVHNKLCIQADCGTRPNYNFIGKKAIYCSTHKKDGMINTRSKLCIQADCGTQPNYNFIGEKAIYCSTHKKRWND